MKKVLLVVIDALAADVVGPALRSGQLPWLAQLAAAGHYLPECISIFPSITPAATATLITGCYPAGHHIAGAYWYDRDQQSVAYYGNDFWVIVNEGMAKFFHDFVFRLNEERLGAETIFEAVERHGLRSGSVNYLWFRAAVEHQFDAPLLMKLLPGMPAARPVHGPHFLYLGDFVTTRIDEDHALKARGGLGRRYGFHDAVTAEILLELAAADALPDLTVAYFPNNDFASHAEGPQGALATLQQADAFLASLADACGGLERMLENSAIVITGDHSQSDLLAGEEKDADLSEVLADFKLVDAGRPWEGDEDLMICHNMRAAQLYRRHPAAAEDRRLTEALLQCRKVDQVIWRERTASGRPDRFHVATVDRGRLVFHLGEGEAEAATDPYGNRWSWTGDLAALDGRFDGAGRIEFGRYPNAFERLAQGFVDEAGDCWVTARLGYEFSQPRVKVSAKGSHGSLHALDSTCPLFVAGLPADVPLPRHPRTVDVTPLCLAALGFSR